MPKSPFDLPATRREFLLRSAGGLGLIAFSRVAPAFLTHSVIADVPAPEKDRSILVLIQLAGGNDGLNTVVPYSDDNYYRLRPKIGLKQDEVHVINDHMGFHPQCGQLANLYKEGQLAIVQNVGYPNPNRSHFRSMEIWETASKSDEYLPTGWLGRYFDNCCSGTPGEDPLGLSIGNELPDAFIAANDHNIFSLDQQRGFQRSVSEEIIGAMGASGDLASDNASFLQHTLMNALVTEERVSQRLNRYRPMVEYPGSPLGRSLRNVAALIASGQETRVYFVSLGGFDTHANQLQRHRNLMGQLSSAMAAFQADLVAHRLDDQVLTMTFSEFGRRPSENISGGTDHGTAAPLFVMGSGLKGPLFGSAPNLDLKKNRDLSYSTDFRSVYSTVIQKWFQTDPLPVLGQPFDSIDFI
ncbi:MAG: DUF1501 domain-containing protein [Opitutales bacterium]|jgi:uncharacterized protein (DUF1501 family)